MPPFRTAMGEQGFLEFTQVCVEVGVFLPSCRLRMDCKFSLEEGLLKRRVVSFVASMVNVNAQPSKDRTVSKVVWEPSVQPAANAGAARRTALCSRPPGLWEEYVSCHFRDPVI